ncbi:MAG: hypothetical protein ABWZ88_00900 [Variovorax sp.]
MPVAKPYSPEPPIERFGQGATASSSDAVDYVRRMQEACEPYKGTPDAPARVDAYLSRYSKDERQMMARRIMIDLMRGQAVLPPTE